jgi:hypothetical protein
MSAKLKMEEGLILMLVVEGVRCGTAVSSVRSALAHAE